MQNRLERNPSGIRRLLQPGDIEIVAALQRHGVLSVWQLAQLCPHFKSIETIRDRLLTLYNDPIWPYGWLIDRPVGQRHNQKFRSTYTYYKRTKDADELLKREGLYQETAMAPAPPLVHQVFLSTLSFSLEYKRPNGVDFLAQYEVSNGFPNEMDVRIDGKDTELKWDAHVGVSLDNRRMYPFIEADRATEGHENLTGRKRKSTRQMFAQYHVVIGKGKHKAHFDVQSDAILLYATVAPGRVKSALSLLEKCPYILCAAFPDFQYFETMPQHVPIYDMYWERSGLPPVKILDLFTE